jgi:hypothetical protein
MLNFFTAARAAFWIREPFQLEKMLFSFVKNKLPTAVDAPEHSIPRSHRSFFRRKSKNAFDDRQ